MSIHILDIAANRGEQQCFSLIASFPSARAASLIPAGELVSRGEVSRTIIQADFSSRPRRVWVGLRPALGRSNRSSRVQRRCDARASWCLVVFRGRPSRRGRLRGAWGPSHEEEWPRLQAFALGNICERLLWRRGCARHDQDPHTAPSARHSLYLLVPMLFTLRRKNYTVQVFGSTVLKRFGSNESLWRLNLNVCTACPLIVENWETKHFENEISIISGGICDNIE